MAWKPRGDPLVIGVGWGRHECETPRRQVLHGGVDVLAAAGDMLNALALILVQIFLDLTFVVGGFIQGNPDLPARTGQRAGIKTSHLSGDVEIADLTEVKEISIKLVPTVHGAAKHIVGQVIDIVDAATRWHLIALAGPVEFGLIGRTLGAKSVDEINQAAADAKDRGSVDGLGAHLAVVRLRAALQRMRKC